VFSAALACTSAADRAAYLDQTCAGDPGLRDRVEALLRAHGRADGFLGPAAGRAETAAFEPAGGEPVPAAGLVPGVVLAERFKLLERVGEGGMGEVWMADQTEPVRRRVALKVIKPGMDSKAVLARFEAERQALALMDHPSIAKVLDAGSTPQGRPFFVMELVKGVSITKYCDEHRLSPRDRLGLFAQVCRAVQHAHQKGVIHRDLKPSNVLVAPYDEVPVPKVIDFGIAKAAGQQLTEKTLFTGIGAVVGTPEYMSPEQAELNNADVDTRSDVYSLGVLLYELLTGTTPLTRQQVKDAAILEVLRLVREEEPPKPSTRLSGTAELPSIAAVRGVEPAKLSRLVRGELDWIVMKALEKDRNRRYESANGLALDLERYLADEPVLAAPPSATYRLGKFVRRHKVALATSSALALAALLVVGSLGWAVRDRAAQRLLIEEGARRALDLSDEYLHQGKWLEAQVEARRADSILASGPAPEDLQQRAAERLADLDMVLRLEAIRTADPENLVNYGGAVTDKAYTDLFREYGIDVERLDPEEVGRQIGRRTIRLELAQALDNWAGLRMAGQQTAPPEAKRLLAMARAADPDEWRVGVRDALGQMDRNRLLELARRPQAAEQPAATVEVLASALWLVQERETAVDILGRAQNHYRDDFRINFALAAMLLHTRPPRAADSIRFYQAALALRPKSPGVLHNLGMALQAGGRLDEALAAFRESVDKNPGWSGGHLSFSYALREKGLLDESIAESREALRLTKDYAEAHVNLGAALRDKGRLDEAIAEYREAVRIKKDLPEVHCNLGDVLAMKGQLDEAIAECREAIRLRNDFPEAHGNLGNALLANGRLDEAIAEFREAIRLRKDGRAHVNLGIALHAKGKLDEAIAEYREAIRLQPDFPDAHTSLGITLQAKGLLDEAIVESREAIRLKTGHAEFHVNLGEALRAKGLLDDAIAEFREAIHLKKDLPQAHLALGLALKLKGEFRTALEELRRGHELGSRNPRWPYPSAQWVRQCERLVELDGKLPGFLEGKATPVSAAERIELSIMCTLKHWNSAAARFYGEAFAVQPKLAAGLNVHRYNAACAAALAGCGQGKDADRLDDKEKARLRGQALDWLRADLEDWRRMADGESDKARAAATVTNVLQHWLADVDLAGVRELEALAKLPQPEREAWQQLWAEVRDRLARAQRKMTPETKSDFK
jgi:tetratricopeptide (TPR) repeat protein/tRNA A-37 threonylcarbamoyl transferase component Bud32